MTAIRISPEAQGSVSLCNSCHWAHIQHGFAESEEAVLCVFLRPARMVPFKVSQCTDYTDKRIPSRRDMEEIAWIIPTKRGKWVDGICCQGRCLRSSKRRARNSFPQTDFGRWSRVRKDNDALGGCWAALTVLLSTAGPFTRSGLAGRGASPRWCRQGYDGKAAGSNPRPPTSDQAGKPSAGVPPAMF